MRYLYILEINFLSLVSFAIIFYHYEGCLFTLFVVSFTVQKLLSIIRSNLFFFFFFYFISITLGGGSQKILLWFMSLSVLPMFSSKSFIVSFLTLRSLIHFQFIFVCGVPKCSNLRLSLFIILPVFNLVVEEIFVKGTCVELFLGQEIRSFKQITQLFF